jgi:hypothetical protein
MKLLQWIKCKLGYHEYYVHQRLTPWSRRVRCKCCTGDWGMNDNVQAFLKWDIELEEFYKEIYGLEIKP